MNETCEDCGEEDGDHHPECEHAEPREPELTVGEERYFAEWEAEYRACGKGA